MILTIQFYQVLQRFAMAKTMDCDGLIDAKNIEHGLLYYRIRIANGFGDSNNRFSICNML